MAKIFILFAALCVVFSSTIVTARPVKEDPYVVRGRVYCDTCKCGYETSATTFIKGAKVRVECKLRNNQNQDVVYSVEGETDSTGTYYINVNEDHKDQVCEAVLVSSPQSDCKKVVLGRERATVILTENNGISSNKRFANNLGFEKDEAAEGCTQLLKQYYTEEDNV